MNAGRVTGYTNWWGAVVCSTLLLSTPVVVPETVVFSTGFETSEGYNAEANLSGQNGWVGSGADGLVTEFFSGLGQQAYIGFQAPSGTEDFFYVYRPINLAPVGPEQSLITFSVMMQIVDSTSTNGPWDDFRWSVYNTNGMRLFSLDFDNQSLLVSYLLDDGSGFVPTDVHFDTQGYYDLVITMNFARNLWSATLNDQVVVNSQPITKVGSPLNLGDINAVWSLRQPQTPGDNFMLFDNYTITADSVPSIPPHLESLGVRTGGTYHARLYGEPGLTYRIEASTDLVEWQPLLSFTAPIGGVLDFYDSTAAGSPRKFYRARQGQ